MCVWGFPRDVVIETPEVCGFEGHFDSTTTLPNDDNYAVELAGRALGVCRVRVELPGTALTDMIDVRVHSGFESIALREDIDTSQEVNDLFVSGPDSLVIVGHDADSLGNIDGMVLRRIQGEWESLPELFSDSGALGAVHGDADGEVEYGVGRQGFVIRYEPTNGEWSPVETGLTSDLYAVWVGAPDDDVWVAGAEGALAHYDGSAWNEWSAAAEQNLRGVCIFRCGKGGKPRRR